MADMSSVRMLFIKCTYTLALGGQCQRLRPSYFILERHMCRT